MKNLPDRFPIRYVLIAKYRKPNDDKKLLNYPSIEEEILFRQLLLLLQKKSITKGFFQIKAVSLKLSFLGSDIINIIRLNASNKWLDQATRKIESLLPDNIELEYSQSFSMEPFNLMVYSYQGGYEIPLFIRTYNQLFRKNNIMGNIVDNLNISKWWAEYFYNTYENVKNSKIKDLKLYELMTRFQKPIYLTIAYSAVLRSLDNGLFKGFVSNSENSAKEGKIKKLPEENINNKKRITIAVCRNWESLFAEEIITLYKMFRFCNNCGKALPFDYKGRYCPDTKRNKDCVKKRARIRSRKRNITKK